MFLFRPIRQTDFEALLELAQFLGQSGNLPLDPQKLKGRIEQACQSFENPSKHKSKNIYMFVLEDCSEKKIVGSSLIFAKHGTTESPHTYLQVLEKTRIDRSTNTNIKHQLLRFEFNSDGPTEIGGLILHPDYRGRPSGLGRQLSYGRFVYMGMNPKHFEKRVIAELLPPFNEDGSSALWEAFGRRFTYMSYDEADQLSRTNKDFIKNLFPQEDIYTCLFNSKAISVIGQTGKKSNPAKRLLEKIGFTYLNSVDPFDGGPHYGAKLQEVTLIKRMQKVELSDKRIESGGNEGLLGFHGKNGFVCFYISFKNENPQKIQLQKEVFEAVHNEANATNEFYLISPI